jgi:hypothetical protein
MGTARTQRMSPTLLLTLFSDALIWAHGCSLPFNLCIICPMIWWILFIKFCRSFLVSQTRLIVHMIMPPYMCNAKFWPNLFGGPAHHMTIVCVTTRVFGGKTRLAVPLW